MSAYHLHLTVPGLLLMEPGLLPPSLHTPALAQLLARATVTDNGPVPLPAALLRLFLPDRSVAATVPAAALCWRAAGEDPADAPCALVNAIALDVGRSGLVLARVLDDSLDAGDWQTLMEELQETFTAHGLRFVWRGDQPFVLLPETLQVLAQPAGDLRGQVIDQHLPRDNGLALMQLLNEIQMQLHRSAFNAGRLAAGLPAVSSLWLWGGGAIPALAADSWRQVATDLPLLRGLALTAAAEVMPPPADPATWLATACDGDRLLLCQDFLRLPVADVAAWGRTFLNFEHSYWGPLFRLLRAGKVSALTIDDPLRGLQFRLDVSAARRWRWRRPGQQVLQRWLAPAHK